MAEAVIYTIFAIFAVYGMYTAARELILFLQRLHGKDKGTRDLCGGCKGCTMRDDPPKSEGSAENAGTHEEAPDEEERNEEER